MILIIANARRKGGLSGSDNIYLNFAEHWGNCKIWDMLRIDFKPFWLCYVYRILAGCWHALISTKKYEFVYSASDFWMDSIPAFILKLKGNKWVAGFYLFAPKKNLIYYYTQKIAYWIIKRFADVVCITNESMFWGFPNPVIAVHGGVDFSLVKRSKEKEYDAVFIGRFHHTKGIKELVEIWNMVVENKPDAKLAVIGGGDCRDADFTPFLFSREDVKCFGFMGNDRFDIYAKSKIVLYTTPPEYSHFSMGPVEAMAWGCPMIAFEQPIMKFFEQHHNLKGCALCQDIECFATAILDYLDGRWEEKSNEAMEWAKTWDWSMRAPKILKQIRGLI